MHQEIFNLDGSKGHTIKPGTPEHGTMGHSTQVQQLNIGGKLEQRRNTGTPAAEHWSTGETIGIPRKSGPGEHQRTNGTTEQRNSTKKYYQYTTTTY